jgi:hypothetical protein
MYNASGLTVSCETQLNDEEHSQNGVDDGDDSHSHDNGVAIRFDYSRY